MIVTLELDVNWPSLAANCKTYFPDFEKVAVVARRLAFPNVTVPGPLALDHVVVSVVFNPSSVADPERLATVGHTRF